MADVRRFSLLDLILFLVILAAAAGVRVWYVSTAGDSSLHVQDTPPSLSLPAHTEMNGHEPPNEVDALVHNLKEHRWFGSLAPFAAAEEQTAHTAPGYPWLLSLLERLPLDLSPLDRTLRWLQCGLGALTTAFYFLFARRAFRSRLVAVLAGLLCAVHPFWLINTAEMNDGVLTTFLLAACIFLGGRGGETGGAFTSFLYGLALAGLALVRAALLPFAFVAILWFLWRCRTLTRGWLYAFLAVLGFVANGLAPWTVRNLQVFGDVIPVVDSVYVHLWMGHNPRATGGPQSEQTMLDALADLHGESPQAVAERLSKLPQRERYNQLAAPVLEAVRSDPAGTLQRRFGTAISFFLGEQWLKDRTVWQGEPSEEQGMPAWLTGSYPAILYGSLLGMLGLGVLGWRWTYGWRYEAMPSSLAMVWIPLPYLLSHAETLSGPRLPLDGVLLCYAAFALACLVPTIGSVLLLGADREAAERS